MYHDTIHINFKYRGDISFDYNFLISKNLQDKFAPIKYGELLQKFEEIEFDIKYLKFNDIYDDETIVYCTYNYQPNFNIFFLAYKKLIKNKNFDICFEYGVILNGIFYPNNMNFFSGILFIDKQKKLGDFCFEEVIKGKSHQKTHELYQLIDKDGKIIHRENASFENNFEQHFFENYDVKVAMRKYKLNRLKLKFDED